MTFSSDDTDIMIHPIKGRKEKGIPAFGLMVGTPQDSRLVLARIKSEGGERRFLFNSELMVSKTSKFFCAGPSVGAPMAAMSLEKLVALGAEKLIYFGWCGAISKEFRIGDILVATRVVSGEGTSKYYPIPEDPCPSQLLNESIGNFFRRENIDYKKCCIWSTDALYRESKKYMKSLQEVHSVQAVDMEFSALCTIGNFRGVEVTGIFLVSDELWRDSWNPGFRSTKFLKSQKSIHKIVCNYMEKQSS